MNLIQCKARDSHSTLSKVERRKRVGNGATAMWTHIDGSKPVKSYKNSSARQWQYLHMCHRSLERQIPFIENEVSLATLISSGTKLPGLHSTVLYQVLTLFATAIVFTVIVALPCGS